MRAPNHFDDVGQSMRANPITGEFESARSFYPLPPIDDPAGNPFNEEVIDLPRVDGADLSYRVWLSNLLSQPSRLAVAVPQTGVPLTEIVRRVGTGQAWGANERWRVDAGLATEFAHNPTMGGAGSENAYPLAIPSALNNELFFSPPLHYRVDRLGGNRLRFQAAVVPLEFNTNGQENTGVGKHSNDRDTLAIWHRCRQFLQVDWNYRPDVHRWEFWTYSPVDYESTPGAFVVNPIGLYLQDLFNQTAGFYDPQTRNLTQLAAADWGNVDTMDVYAERRFTIYNGAASRFDPPVVGNFACSLLQAPGDVLSCGLAVRLGYEDRCATIRNVLLQQQRAASHPAPAFDTNSGQIMVASALSDFGRRAGWLGFSGFLCFAPTAGQLLTKFDALYRNGTLARDNPDPNVLPPHVTAGTLQLATWGVT